MGLQVLVLTELEVWVCLLLVASQVGEAKTTRLQPYYEILI